jgi:uncharacterized membrane protein
MITMSVLNFVLTFVLGSAVMICLGCMLTLTIINRSDRRRDAKYDAERKQMRSKILGDN